MHEPLGLVAVEAMSCKTPVIAVREGGVREFVKDDYNGYLVDPEPKQIADKINLLKPERLKKLSDNARKTAVSFSWNNFNKNLEKEILRIIK